MGHFVTRILALISTIVLTTTLLVGRVEASNILPQIVWESYDNTGSNPPKLNIEYTVGGGIVAPTVVTNAASDIEATTVTASGNITATGSENSTTRGFEWDTDTGAPYSNNWTEDGSFGVGNFTHGFTDLPSGTTIYLRAMAYNSGGWGYGDEVSFLTKPAAPTNVAASDGTSTDNVTITWTKSTGATDYQVYRDGNALGWIGDLAEYVDTGAGAPSITAGSAVASDGTSTSQISLSISAASANNGTTHTYKVRAKNATGESSDSSTNTGYRGIGALTYQWQKSSADSDTDYGNIGGATGATYNDTDAPTPTITPGTTSASDNTSSAYVTLTVSGQAGNNGAGRYYQAVLTAAGATENTTASNRGYRGTATLIYQWYVSDNDIDTNFSLITGATTNPYNHTEGVVYPDGRYYFATIGMSGAVSDNTTHDRGYKSVAPEVLLAPTDFTITDLGGSTAKLDWTLGDGADNTLIRMRRDIYPTSITDGESVYFDSGTTTNQTGLSLDITTYYYRAWSEASGEYSEDYAGGTTGGSNMIFLGIIGFAAIMSFVAFKSNFFGLKLLAGMVWFPMVFLYIQSNPPAGITEGSGVHTAMLVISVGFGLMIVLSGLGRGITRSRKWGNSEEVMGGGFQWKLPDWMKFNEDEPKKRARNTEQELMNYRETLRRAYHSGEFRRGRR